MRIGSLFSGAGGLDLAVAAVFGGEIVWHAEIDKAASKVLAHRFPGVPNLGDITAVGWAGVPAVDVLCGGFPCQDVSAAGKRAGIKAGTRSGLWSVFADAIDALRPQWVVIENVRGLLSATAQRTVDDADSLEPSAGVVGDGSDRPVLRALGAVLGDLCDLRYDAQWATVAAADVGAPHRRERVFILAEIADAEGTRRSVRHTAHIGQADREVNAFADDCGIAADAKGDGWDEGRPESAGQQWRSDAAVSGDESGVALLPTPCAQQSGNTPENHLGKKPGRKVVTDLAILVENGLLETGGALLPTPAACNPNDGETPETWLRRRDEVKDRVGNGNGMGMPLSIAVQLLPTPTTQDAANNAGPSQYERNTLPLNAVAPLLPTPNAERVSSRMDTRLSGDGRTEPNKLGWAIAELLPTPEAKNSHAGPDYARMNREGSGGHDLVTALSLLPTHAASDATGGGSHPDSRQGHSRQLIDYALLDSTTAWGKYEPAIRRWEQINGPAPAPTEPNKNGNPRLSAAFSEWMMGWPPGWVTDPAIGISRNDQLRIVGNGVCPQQAVAALRFLLAVAR